MSGSTMRMCSRVGVKMRRARRCKKSWSRCVLMTSALRLRLQIRPFPEGARSLRGRQFHRSFHSLHQVRNPDRLDEIGVGTDKHPRELFVVLDECAQNHEGCLDSLRVAAQGTDELVSVETGHADVHNDTVRARREEL